MENYALLAVRRDLKIRTEDHFGSLQQTSPSLPSTPSLQTGYPLIPPRSRLSEFNSFESPTNGEFTNSYFRFHSEYVSRFDKFSRLVQTSTVAQFQSDFEELMNKVTGASESLLISFFVLGLKPDISRELLLCTPLSLAEAFAAAQAWEDRLIVMKMVATQLDQSPKTTGSVFTGFGLAKPDLLIVDSCKSKKWESNSGDAKFANLDVESVFVGDVSAGSTTICNTEVNDGGDTKLDSQDEVMNDLDVLDDFNLISGIESSLNEVVLEVCNLLSGNLETPNQKTTERTIVASTTIHIELNTSWVAVIESVPQSQPDSFSYNSEHKDAINWLTSQLRATRLIIRFEMPPWPPPLRLRVKRIKSDHGKTSISGVRASRWLMMRPDMVEPPKETKNLIVSLMLMLWNLKISTLLLTKIQISPTPMIGDHQLISPAKLLVALVGCPLTVESDDQYFPLRVIHETYDALALFMGKKAATILEKDKPPPWPPPLWISKSELLIKIYTFTPSCRLQLVIAGCKTGQQKRNVGIASSPTNKFRSSVGLVYVVLLVMKLAR